MWEKICIFITENWLNLLLAIGGLSAFFIYISQEKRKVSDAASLIILQVEDLQKRISEIGSFIVNGNIDYGAFYESQPILKTDYWNEYKHYFIKKMDAFSFNTFDEFYNCIFEILEQQQLMKDLQKNFFFLVQQNQAISNPFIPDQIRISIENALKKYHSISIIGCEGYRKLKKIGKRKF